MQQLNEHAVLIVGGGPTGLTLACELALAGIDVAIVEQRTSQELTGSRAGGLHPRTLELFDQRGVADRFVSQGEKHPVIPAPGVLLDIGDLPTRYAYWLKLWQNQIERLLADWAAELTVPIYRGCEVVDIVQNESGVYAALADGRSLRAAYLVGCDGGRSLIRKKAGIGFPGWDATISSLIFEAEMAEEPALGIQYGAQGINALGKLEGEEGVRGVLTERELQQGREPTFKELRETLIAAYGTDYGVRNVRWLSRFTDAARQAESYRKGRIFLAGDAAHTHSPAGGQGLNIGVQDAVNLGWKLAQAVKGASGDSLLDSYHAERHPVGARLLRTTMALSALQRGDAGVNAIREFIAEPFQMDGPRQWYAARMSGLDVHYECGEGHALLGRRMPDLDLITAEGPKRVFSLLHAARPALLNFGKPGAVDIAPWADRVRLVDASHDGAWMIPVLGAVTPPAAVLIRPDGYIAWVGEQDQKGLTDALGAWFGPSAGPPNHA